MKLKLNPDYAKRHLFVTLLMLGMGGWFGYDGLIRYPATPAAQLYREIEKADAPAGFDLEGFKAQKTKTQYGFTVLTLLVAAVVGLRLLKAKKFDFEFDDDGFAICGKHYSYKDVKNTDRSSWEKKNILAIELNDGTKITLDGWHHLGVKEFAAHLSED